MGAWSSFEQSASAWPRSDTEWDFDEAAEAPAPTSAALRANIVMLATRECERWRDGAITERDPRAVPMLYAYWTIGVPRAVARADFASAAWQADNPWSAALVSWVMRTAGAAGFAFAQKHRTYISAAKRNRESNNTANPFWAFRATETGPAPGDIVCRTRGSLVTTYENVNDGKGRTTHGDIVVATSSGKAEVIGGNVSGSVKRRDVALDSRGFVDLASHPDVFAIVKLRDLPLGAASAMTTAAARAQPSINVDDAVRKNRFYGSSLGWTARIAEIGRALGLPSNPDERSLAQSVAQWQAKQGLSVDGVIGPNTWKTLRATIDGAPTPAAVPAAAPVTAPGAKGYDIRRIQPKWSRPGNTGHWLEGGIRLRGTMKIVVPPGTTDPSDIIMAAIAGVETSTYDDLNLYDRGILTWGISQWTLHADSLQKLLRAMKTDRPALFKRLFQDRGVDVGTREMEIVLNGRLCSTVADIRLAIKGDRNGRAKNDTTPWTEAMFKRMESWARLFGDAARDTECQAFQRAYAVRQYRADVLAASIDRWAKVKGYGRVSRYADRNLLVQAMLCGLYVNNPTGSMVVMARTIDHFRKANGGQTDPARWSAGWQGSIGPKFMQVGAVVGPARGLTEWPRRIAMQKSAYDKVVGTRSIAGFAL